MSTLSNIVAKFRKQSPNIAAAFDEVERRIVVVETRPAGALTAISPSGGDDTAALQAALDRTQAVTLTAGIFKTTATLKLNAGQYLWGPGLGDFGCTIEFRGSPVGNCFEMKVPDLSKFWSEGVRVQDRRVGATGGSGYYLYRPKNLVVVKRGAVMGFPAYGVAAVADSGQNDLECIHIEDMWFSCGIAGAWLTGVSNNVTLHHIMGDGLVGENTMQALVRLGYTLRGGAAFHIGGLKLETDNGCHVLDVMGNCRGAIHASGLTMRGPNANGGGDIIRLQALEAGETRSVVAQALSSVTVNGDAKVCQAFINNGGTVVGDPAMRSLAHWSTG